MIMSSSLSQRVEQFRWPNTVYARAVANSIQRVHKYCIKTNKATIQPSFYLPNIRAICTIFLHKWTQCIDGFTLLLQRYVRKGNDTKNSTQLFLCCQKNPVKCSACISRKNCDWVKTWLLGDTPIYREPLIRISRNWARNETEVSKTVFSHLKLAIIAHRTDCWQICLV